MSLPLTRRVVGGGLLAASLAGGRTDRAFAAGAQFARQAPSFYRFRIGSFEVTTIYDGQLRRPIDATYVDNAPLEAVRASLSDALLPVDYIDNPYTFTAVNTGSQLVLVDAGSRGKFAPTVDKGPENLAAAGLDPAQVDLVIMTHLHPDHVLGLTDGQGRPTFPKAEILVPDAEWAFWMDDGAMSRASGMIRGFFAGVRAQFGPNRDRVRPFAANGTLASGFTAIAAPGHTPGHTAVAVHDGADQVVILGDAVTYPAVFVRNPDWHLIFDMDPVRAVESRRTLLDRVSADRSLVVGFHFPFPSVGRIATRERGFAYLPAPWSSDL